MIHTLARFPVGGAQLCVDRSSVRSDVEAPNLTRAPGAPRWLLGAWNHLGRAVAVIDIAAFAGVNRDPVHPDRLVLVETPSGVIGIAATGPVSEQPAPTFRRRNTLLEVVDASSDLLFVDLTRLCEVIEESMAL